VNAHEVRKKTFIFYVAVIRKTTGGNTGTQEQRKGGGNKIVEVQWKLLKNKKNVTKYVCLCSSTMLTSKIITAIILKNLELRVDLGRMQ